MKYKLVKKPPLPTAKVIRKKDKSPTGPLDGYVVNVERNTRFIIPIYVGDASPRMVAEHLKNASRTIDGFIGENRCLLVPLRDNQDLTIYELEPVK